LFRQPISAGGGRYSYLDGQGDTDEEVRRVLQSHPQALAIPSAWPKLPWAGWHSFGRAALALTIMLGDRGRFDCSVVDGVDADSEPSSPLLALAGLVGLGKRSQQVG
jgi:hypothetical protein